MNDEIKCEITEQKKSPSFLDHQKISGTARTVIISGVTDQEARRLIVQIVDNLPIPYDYLHKTIPDRSVRVMLTKDTPPKIEIHFDDFSQDGQNFLDNFRQQSLTSIPAKHSKSYSSIGFVDTDTEAATTSLQLTLAYQAVFQENVRNVHNK